MADTPLHVPKLPGAALTEQVPEQAVSREQVAVSQYVHLGADDGDKLAFGQLPGWAASSWQLDDPRVESADTRTWLKKQQCALLHLTLDTEATDLQRTAATRLARLQRRANRVYLFDCSLNHTEKLTDFFKDESVRRLQVADRLLVSSTSALLQSRFFSKFGSTIL